MKYITKLKLAAIHQICDKEDKSTEYTIQVMMNIVNVELDTIINYFGLGESIHSNLFKEVNELASVVIDIDSLIQKKI